MDWGIQRVVRVAILMGLTSSSLLISSSTALACHDPFSPWNTAYKPGGTGWIGSRVSSPGMGVFDGDVDCGRVSSLFVTNAGITRFVEVGWYETPQGQYACLPSTSGPPRILAFSSFDGMDDCKTASVELSEGNDNFWVHDDNQNGVWNYFRNGTEVWSSPDISPFNSGLSYNNGERLNFNNTAHADFDGLKRMNSLGNWVNWTNTTLDTILSDDTGSHGCKYSNTHTAVKLIGTAC